MQGKLLSGIDRTTRIAKHVMLAGMIPILLPATVMGLFSLVLSPMVAWAGPPFVTDDPEPVEYRHWEFYLASQDAKNKEGWSGTAPHFEVNYGALPNLQLHMIAPLAYAKPNDGSARYGFGDLELGAKYRFIQETDWRPQVGTFTMLEVPTGSSSKGLGSGQVRAFLPIWLQKSWGPWQSYGGGGYWINPGSENKDYWFFGWQVQRELSKVITLGAEVFYNTPTAREEGGRTGFNVGTIVNFTDEHHLLFSTGRDIHGQNRFSVYVAYQLTIGPQEEKKEEKSEKK
ncbi:MAG TPA: transporter [Thermodesulfobacteriota bacterium]|nr:transporter [Thermodesulfobacteriota bacterium]